MNRVGSPNFGSRSMKSDFETQLYMISENKQYIFINSTKLIGFLMNYSVQRFIMKWTPYSNKMYIKIE